MNKKNILLLILSLLFAAFLLSYGESGYHYNLDILIELRIPKVIGCLLAGGLLATSGLLMQIFFQNPLAGPDILGVSSGSSLFVAIWILAASSLSQSMLHLGMGIMSFLGAFSVFLLLLFFLQKNMSRVSLVIVGLLISSFASSGISVLISSAEAVQLKSYLMWSMGSFRNLTSEQWPLFCFLSLLSLAPVFFLIKALNQFSLSENYAKSMGLNIKRAKIQFITLAAFQISLVTLYCGPVGFIGIISPHLARTFHKTSNLFVILPASFLIGAILAFLAEVILTLLPTQSLSLNSILGIIGAPVIVLYLYHQRDRGI